MSEVETRTCRQCGQEYLAEYWDVGGLLRTRVLKGNGYCPDCCKSLYEEETNKESLARQLESARIRKERRENAGIPPKFMNQDFSTFEKGWQDKALKKCIDYANKYPVDKRPTGYLSLYLWSDESWGVGKTHLASAICHRILERWNEDNERHCPIIVFVSEPELFRRIQATYSFSQEEKRIRQSEDEIIQGIIYADLVVIDDVGKVEFKDLTFLRRVMFDIISGRYDNNLPLIITANLNPDGLKKHLDKPPTEANFDRFFEMTNGKVINMNGRSYRRGK